MIVAMATSRLQTIMIMTKSRPLIIFQVLVKEKKKSEPGRPVLYAHCFLRIASKVTNAVVLSNKF